MAAAPQTPRVLFVLTAHDRLGPADDGDADATGFHLAEAARPWRTLTAADITVDIATPSGRPAPVDPGSCDRDDADNRAFLEDSRVAAQLANPHRLDMIDVASYDGLYFPGGHGTMWDFPEDPGVQHAARTLFEGGKPVAAVCHGPAALVNVKLSDGAWLVDGRRVSVFTDSEERAAEKADEVPFLLASALEKRGARHRKSGDFECALSVDGNLITGQNPASAGALGEALRDAVLGR